MKPSLERLERPHRQSFRGFVAEGRGFHFHWHYHREYELTLITAGHGRRLVGSDVIHFRAPDLVLIGPDIPHTWDSKAVGDERHRAIVVQFAAEPLSAALTLPELRGIGGLLERARVGLVFSPAACARAAPLLERMADASGAERLLALLAAFDALAADGDARGLAMAALPRLDRASERRIDAVRRHLVSRYTGPIRQREIARLAGMTVPAFSRFFKRVTGRTMVAWLRDLRVGHACDLLANSDQPVTRICFASGFTSVSQFNACFRSAKGMSPRAYRRAFVG